MTHGCTLSSWKMEDRRQSQGRMTVSSRTTRATQQDEQGSEFQSQHHNKAKLTVVSDTHTHKQDLREGKL